MGSGGLCLINPSQTYCLNPREGCGCAKFLWKVFRQISTLLVTGFLAARNAIPAMVLGHFPARKTAAGKSAPPSSPKMVNSQEWLGEGGKGILSPGSKSLPRVFCTIRNPFCTGATPFCTGASTRITICPNS